MIAIADDFAPQTQQEWDQVRAALLQEFGWQCAYCGRGLTWKASEIDHAVPRCQGGADHFANLHPSCKPCNCSKGGRTVAQWRGDVA